jgi:uncharacterized protein YjbI with pentapeptide repeats
VADTQQPWQVLRRWRERWPRWLLRTAALAVLAVLIGVVWWRWELAGLAGLAVASVIALVGRLIFWAAVVPDRLAPPLRGPDLAGVRDAKARLEAIDARTRLRHDLRYGPLQGLTVLAALAVAGVGFWQLAEDRDKARQDRQLTERGQASERFTRAINQLGNRDRVETRIGGIYGLDQIAEQFPEENTGPVGEVLLAWLNGRPRADSPPKTPLREDAPDVQAALTVLAEQRYASIVDRRLDLHRLGLGGADLRGVNLRGANLSGAYMSDANLSRVNLSGANLAGAELSYANLDHANLNDANLDHTDFWGADLRGADLRDASMIGADLSSAQLQGATLIRAFLFEGSLSGAKLEGANLSGANLERVTLEGANPERANLKGAGADTQTRWPEGFDWRRAGVRASP